MALLHLVHGPQAARRGLDGHAAEGGVAQRRQEVGQALGDAPHHVAAVAVLGQEEGQLQQRLLRQLHLAAVRPGQLVRNVLRDLFEEGGRSDPRV